MASSSKALDYNSQGNLCLYGTELQSLERSGPSYIYSKSLIKSKCSELKAAFQKISQERPLEFYYATKANFHPHLLRLIFSQGFGADVVSGGEMQRALENGVAAEKIIFSGVGKSVQEITVAIQKSIGQINVESVPELERILQISQNLQKKISIGIRVNPDVDPKTHPSIATGLKENKFGIDLADLDSALNLVKDSQWVKLIGLSVHIGSQISDIAAVAESIQRIQPYYLKHQWSIMDLGGGFRVDYKKSNEEDTLYIQDYASEIEKTLSWYKGKVCFEPGRFIVARAGVLLAQVEYVKKTKDKNFLILNSGMNHFLRPALYSAEHRLFPLKKTSGSVICYDVVGPVCESSDVILRNALLPEMKSGDWVAIADTGAYGYVMASNYNLFPMPGELLVD